MIEPVVIGPCTLFNADCRDVLPTLSGVDAVVTDPPYQSLDVDVSNGTTTRLVSRDEFSGKRRAASDGKEWFATLSPDDVVSVLDICRDALHDEGAMYVFTDVKSGLELLPRLRCRNVIIWDKQKIGMGYSWRRMHEWIGYSPREKHKLRDLSAGDIIRCPTVLDKQHPTEKPVKVIERILHNSTDPGATVFDPFMGSGTTGVASVRLNRRFIGVEISPAHFATACRRIRAAVAAEKSSLFPAGTT